MRTQTITQYRIRFADGSITFATVWHYDGACLTGQPTVFCYRGKNQVWLLPDGDGFKEAK